MDNCRRCKKPIRPEEQAAYRVLCENCWVDVNFRSKASMQNALGRLANLDLSSLRYMRERTGRC